MFIAVLPNPSSDPEMVNCILPLSKTVPQWFLSFLVLQTVPSSGFDCFLITDSGKHIGQNYYMDDVVYFPWHVQEARDIS